MSPSRNTKLANPFNAGTTQVLRTLCDALYALNTSDHEEYGKDLATDLCNSSNAFGSVHKAIKQIIETTLPELKGTGWANNVNYGGNESFFDDFCIEVCYYLEEARIARMTIEDVKTELAEYRMTVTRKNGEYRVNFDEGSEDSAYYTDDKKDALETGKAMRDELTCIQEAMNRD